MIPIAILCGGRGTRIAAFAGDLPKALLEVAGEPFLAHQLRWLCRAGAYEVVLLTGYRGDIIQDFARDGSNFGLSIRYSDDGPIPRGTAGAVRRALPLLGERFITIYGDALLDADMGAVAAALKPPYDGVMTVFRNNDVGLPSNVLVDGDRVQAYDKQAPPGTMTHIDYGVNAFRAHDFAALREDVPVDLAEVHRTLINRGTLRAFPVERRWYEIGSPAGLAETEAYLGAGRAGGVERA